MLNGVRSGRRRGRPQIWPGSTRRERNAAFMRAYRARKTVIRLAWVEAIILDAKRTKSLKRKAWHKRRDKELAAERLERDRLANLPSSKFWCGVQLSEADALRFIREQVVPQQREIAKRYLAQVTEECRKAGLNVNTYTLRKDGVKDAIAQRRLCWNASCSYVPWKQAVEQSSKKTAANIMRHRDARMDELFDEQAARLGNGSTIASELDKPAF
jgi:hypothetical protein